jgi:hypothetical protein
MKRIPYVTTCLIAGASLMVLAGVSKADDHLVQATDFGGLTLDSQPYQTNPAGRGGDLAPGQGSPFTGEETKTPATDTPAAQNNVKDRTPK